MPSDTTPARRIGLVIYPGFKTLEATGPLSVLHYANEHLRAAGRDGGYEVTVMAPEPGPIRSDTLMSLEATAPLPQADLPGTVFIVGAAGIEEALRREDALVRWCLRHGRQAERFAAFCTGSYFLAAAGLLDRQRAATHWNYAARLKHLFPDVEVDADAIFVQSGNLWTSAGVTAAIDLTLAFVEQDYGRDIALRVARDMVMYLKRPGGQSQFSTVLTGQMSGASGMADVCTWASLSLERPMTLDDLAARAGMSVRSFTRAFTAEVDVSPMAWLEGVRCDRARTLLLDGNLSVKAVAARAGFSSDEQMRKVFRRRFSLSPSEYRARFSTTQGG